MFEMPAVDECIAAKQREVERQGLAEEILREWLLPRYGPALRRMRAARAGKSARTRKQYESRFELFADDTTPR